MELNSYKWGIHHGDSMGNQLETNNHGDMTSFIISLSATQPLTHIAQQTFKIIYRRMGTASSGVTGSEVCKFHLCGAKEESPKPKQSRCWMFNLPFFRPFHFNVLTYGDGSFQVPRRGLSCGDGSFRITRKCFSVSGFAIAAKSIHTED